MRHQAGRLMPVGLIRYWAAAKEAAGTAEEPYDAGTLGEALAVARSRHGARFGVVLDGCSYVVDGGPVGGREPDSVPLSDGGVVEVLPPFAGGAEPERAPRGTDRPAAAGRSPAAGKPAARKPAAKQPAGKPAAKRASATASATNKPAATASAGKKPASQPPAPGAASLPSAPQVESAVPLPIGAWLPVLGRSGPLASGVIGALTAGVLAIAAVSGRPVLAFAVLLAQVPLLTGWLTFLDAPGVAGGVFVGAGAALTADLLLLEQDRTLAGLAGVVGISLVGALAAEILRPRRDRVTESLAATLSAVSLAAMLAMVIALRSARGGKEAAATAMFALAAALVAGRLADAALARPELVPRSRRGPLGLLVGLAAGAGVGAAYGAGAAPLDATSGAVLGLAVALAAAAADLAAAVATAELPVDARFARRSAGVLPVAALLPVAAAAPVAYLAGRLLVG